MIIKAAIVGTCFLLLPKDSSGKALKREPLSRLVARNLASNFCSLFFELKQVPSQEEVFSSSLCSSTR